MEEKILKILGQKDYVPANATELLKALNGRPQEKKGLLKLLKELELAGRIARIKEDRFILPLEADLIPGRIQITRQGRGFLTPDDENVGEVSIPATETGTAFHEDRVLVRLDVSAKGGEGESRKGTVVRVLERRRNRLVGTLSKGRQFLYVIPDDPRFPHDIYVQAPKDVGRPARVGDKVVVELLEWESRHTNPEGEIIEVLGDPSTEGVDMLGVLRQYDLPLSFPRPVLQEARRFGTRLSEVDYKGRVDCRGHRVITIDPDDAKDFDDAFYLEAGTNGQWKLWVHIADVSYYVKPGSKLDVEAKKRGNSTYLVDRVIPMLPEALSNELCSLKPKVDRLTQCVEFLLGSDGKVLRSKFYPAVIHSKRRFTYQEALSVLQGKAESEVETMLHQAHELAQKIRKERFRNGSLDLDFPEHKIRLDESGKVDHIERMENDISHQLIEEFMLLANEAVAGRLMRTKRPAIYRIHEAPDERRLEEYRQLVLSHNLPCGHLSKPAEVQKLLKLLGTLAIGPALKIGFLKSLTRARYSVEPLGHYGLAKTRYCHFTSPIRRYADLIVHRSLMGESGGEGTAALKAVSDHISLTERNSADAERDSRDVKLYAYLNQQVSSGEKHRYRAMVTDIRNFGFFVDVLELGMSGLVPLSKIKEDFFVFDGQRHQVQGRRSRRVIRLGDAVEVEVLKVDFFKKQVDFSLMNEKRESNSKGTRDGKARHRRGRGGNSQRNLKDEGRKRGRKTSDSVKAAPSGGATSSSAQGKGRRRRGHRGSRTGS